MARRGEQLNLFTTTRCIEYSSSNRAVRQKPIVVVVLLGWLGAKQRHLQKYADWYNAQGIHAVKFTMPLWDVFSLRAEQRILDLESKLSNWMMEKDESGREKVVLVHTFSNTGWLSYGVLLERMMQRDTRLLHKIKGCVVDSAPAPEMDPEVYASGVLTALRGPKEDTDIVEAGLKAGLKRFFNGFFANQRVKTRLREITEVLTKHQPVHCPQLYVYSSADRVISSRYVESFMKQQMNVGRDVKGYDFKTSPHVDHLRSFPEGYSYLLHNFIKKMHSMKTS